MKFKVPGKMQVDVQVEVEAHSWEEALECARECRFTRGDIKVKMPDIDTFCADEDVGVAKEFTLSGALLKGGRVKVKAHTLDEAIKLAEDGCFESYEECDGDVFGFRNDGDTAPVVRKV